MLENIYVVRHGYRMNWVVDPKTGQYASAFPTPTGIASDPTLASYGVTQSEQLGEHLGKVQPPVDLVYCSPWYRCIQTLQPFAKKTNAKINLEAGVGEFYGQARFDHPSPALLAELQDFFPNVQATDYVIVPSTNGESLAGIHDRVAYALNELIKRADADPAGPKALLICTHAAVMIAIGRALTGRMPEDESEEDFACYTCAFSRYSRKGSSPAADVTPWTSTDPDTIPDVRWRGPGVAGGWTCEVNGDCSFLTNGPERGWRFFGDESFLKDPNAFNDKKNESNKDGDSKL